MNGCLTIAIFKILEEISYTIQSNILFITIVSDFYYFETCHLIRYVIYNSRQNEYPIFAIILNSDATDIKVIIDSKAPKI